MPYLQIRGVEHYYEWVRSPDCSATQPVMVFLHGWGGSARYWQSTAESISTQFACLLYDLRGFGRSRLPQNAEIDSQIDSQIDCELETYAEDLAELLDSLGIEKVYLNAHSMGATIATLFLNRYPQRVERAILTCSGIFEYNEQAFKAFHKFGGQVVKVRPRLLLWIPGVDRIFMARFLHRSLPSQLRREFLEDFILADYQAALGTIYTSVSQKMALGMPEEFARIQTPTLLVSGEYDRIIPAEMGERAASLSENVEYALIRDTGHFPMLEDASSYLAAVRSFLESSDR
ncbi:alpha/beta hydrolase [Oscillatoriales cyanobacterium LEGE 11467]|uniref:Alpha/beta hydrolase n=1 Tax=Zarconia navalis LEGE 11467 TaxID=1828826 RepID=A0A928VXP1_9CYAN|nr:alpha/beta hydrolase [Zarconia navalis]MBE9041193.1 alpha/beta hydrolase [Zarconia navalis LEGE 11467]